VPNTTAPLTESLRATKRGPFKEIAATLRKNYVMHPTRCFIDNPEEIADRSSLMDVRKNVDGRELAPTPAGR
jgi:hypothetical protein